MTVTEQKALTPHQEGWFDEGSWENSCWDYKKKGWVKDKEWKKWEEYWNGREQNPSLNKIIPDDEPFDEEQVKEPEQGRLW